MYESSRNGPTFGFGSPNVRANSVQLVTRVGMLAGPIGVRPTNAATDVATPSMGLLDGGTSVM